MDWSKTPIGDVETWSPALRMMVRLLLANRFPLLLWWGPRYCQLYNDAYRPVFGDKHPASMGQPASECFPEIWDVIGPLIDTPFNGGSATWMDDLRLEYIRYDRLEESCLLPDSVFDGSEFRSTGRVHAQPLGRQITFHLNPVFGGVACSAVFGKWPSPFFHVKLREVRYVHDGTLPEDPVARPKRSAGRGPR